jgi:hypothetical protein
LSKGAIAGTVVGVVGGVAILAPSVWLCFYRRHKPPSTTGPSAGRTISDTRDISKQKPEGKEAYSLPGASELEHNPKRSPEGFTQHYPQLAIAENRCRFSVLVMKSLRLFDKKPRMMVPLAIFFPQACVAGRRKPESRARNTDRPRKIVDSLLVRHLCHWIRFTEDEIPTVLLVRHLRHWICFTEGVMSSVILATRAHTRQCAHDSSECNPGTGDSEKSRGVGRR